ncbi:hypothetical protein GH714_003231 [Hevea brasiliensis]|uniref:Uncharacterized protein n=1 Tax=Hevea brasiliensis TaxID=3981 RepID=A0A6A6KGA8_HEVBR|nr:hypothetical protein GH714_003231 [Hevea brasiliensis]
MVSLPSSELAAKASSGTVSFFSLLGDAPSCPAVDIFLAGGAEQTGTTDLIRTAGAMKRGCTLPKSILGEWVLAEYKGPPVLILGGAGICAVNSCDLETEQTGPIFLICTGGAADEGLCSIVLLLHDVLQMEVVYNLSNSVFEDTVK